MKILPFCRSAVLPLVAGVVVMPAAAFAQREAEPVTVLETPEHLRVPGRIFLQMTREARETGEGEQFVRTMTEMFGGRVLRRYNTLLPGMVLLEVPVGHERMIAEVAHLSREIESVGWDTWGVPNSVPNDPRAVNGEMWWRSRVCIDPVWNAGITDASGVVVAVIDSGVNYLHPDLAPNMWKNQVELNGAFGLDDDGNGVTDDVHGAAFYWPSTAAAPACSVPNCLTNFHACRWVPADGNDLCEQSDNNEAWLGIGNSPLDSFVIYSDIGCECDPTLSQPVLDPLHDNGHGTLSAAMVAAVGNNNAYATGAAWTARMMPVRVNDHYWAAYRVSDFIAGLDYAVASDSDVKVISCSITYAPSSALKAAVEALGDFDVVLVTCAGNGGFDIDGSPMSPFRFPVGYAEMRHVLGVGATDLLDKRAIFSSSSSSNWGIESVDVFAPGVELPALGTLYGGTSGATPIVAGIVAMYRTHNPGKLATEVVDDVVFTASPRSALSGLCVSGGIVDAAELFGLTGCP